MTLPFPPNTLLIILICRGIFFSLPTQEFFRGQGKIKVGLERKNETSFIEIFRRMKKRFFAT